MIALIQLPHKEIKVNLSKPIDISIPLKDGDNNPSAWYVPPVRMEAVKMGNWVGNVKEGGSVNFYNVFFNPHGHGTHTECVGHISREKESVNEAIKTFYFFAQLISVKPNQQGNDMVIEKESLEANFQQGTEAVIIRTLPNDTSKLLRQYSNTNPPYMSSQAAAFLRDKGVKHLLIDLPSVDREDDKGLLVAHHAFWNFPQNTRHDSSITELIFVPNKVCDGYYLLNLNIAPFDNDAAPSRPTLYEIL